MQVTNASKLALVASLYFGGKADSFVLHRSHCRFSPPPSKYAPSIRDSFEHHHLHAALSSDVADEFRGSDRFERWRFLQNFLDNECQARDANRLLFLVLDGFLKYPRPAFKGETGSPEMTDDLRSKIENVLDNAENGFIPAFEEPNCSPGKAAVLEGLTKLLPDPIEDEDSSKSLWDILIQLHGRELVKFNETNPSPEWKAICLVARLLIHFDFLTDGIVEGPLI